jgi:hypothetical protein
MVIFARFIVYLNACASKCYDVYIGGCRDKLITQNIGQEFCSRPRKKPMMNGEPP